ncbi:MAG: acyl carrier protein [Clostridium sp.]|nr:acyl carrier protein [Clostridium sp.]
MEELIEILMDIDPDVDYETCDTLVEDGILTSFEMVMLVTEINQRMGVSIPPEDIIPENFASAQKIYELIEKTRGE